MPFTAHPTQKGHFIFYLKLLAKLNSDIYAWARDEAMLAILSIRLVRSAYTSSCGKIQENQMSQHKTFELYL